MLTQPGSNRKPGVNLQQVFDDVSQEDTMTSLYKNVPTMMVNTEIGPHRENRFKNVLDQV